MTKIGTFVSILFSSIVTIIVILLSTMALVLIFFSAVGNAAPPILVDKLTGKYLGNLSANSYDQNSTSNPYGRHGSEYSPDSVNNPYGRYGSEYSNDSPNNPYATNPPVIIHFNRYYDY